MSYTHFISLAAGIMQAGVALYALRLSSLFGTLRVGWSLFGAFALLALLHLTQGFDTQSSVVNSQFGPEFIYLLVSLFLFVGLAHMESTVRARSRLEGFERRAREQLETLVQEKTAALRTANAELETEIARRKQDHLAVQASERQYRFLFAENPQPMWIVDQTTRRFLNVNKQATRHYGYTREEFFGMQAGDLEVAEQPPPHLAADSKPAARQHRPPKHRTRDGKLISVEFLASEVVYDGRAAQLVLINDVTERHHLEEHLRQAQKMDAIGQLAGGVAHDFNNVLAVIIGQASLWLDFNGKDDPTETMKEIAAAADRASNLTRQLLAFSRRNVIRREPLDLNDAIRNLSKMLKRLIGEDVVLQDVYEPHLPPVFADAGMVEQVILNLAINARDAMPKGGTLTIQTASVEFNDTQVRRYGKALSGQHVCLTVRDTGTGMNSDVLNHIFEPFFTTKEVGRGTGLGLATVYGIIKQHSGWIEVESQVGAGSEFRVYFPLADLPLSRPRHASVSLSALQGQETILVVEDEERVRNLIRLLLTRNGYRVIEADRATTAMEIWKARADEIDLVLTDLVMPGCMYGTELADQLRAIKPDVRVLFMSGYSPSRGGRNMNSLDGLDFIAKPFTSTVLVRTIRDRLDNPVRPARPGAVLTREIGESQPDPRDPAMEDTTLEA